MFDSRCFVGFSEKVVVNTFLRYRDKLGFDGEIVMAPWGYTPDCFLYKNGRATAIEFETVASHFILHWHQVFDCDLLVCWFNDFTEFKPLSMDEWIRKFELEKVAEAGEIKILELESELNRVLGLGWGKLEDTKPPKDPESENPYPNTPTYFELRERMYPPKTRVKKQFWLDRDRNIERIEQKIKEIHPFFKEAREAQ